MKTVWIPCMAVCVGALCGFSGNVAAAPVEDLRLLSLMPACFEYRFTAVVSAAGDQPVFSLNHIHGRTFFVKPGDTIGPYTLQRYTLDSSRIFNTSLNAFQTVRNATLTLEQPRTGEHITLRLGETLPMQGWTGEFIALQTGQRQYARTGSTLQTGGETLPVMNISSNGAIVLSQGQPTEIPLISTEEQAALNARLTALARTQAAQNALAEQAALAQQERQARFDQAAQTRWALPQKKVHIQGPPRFFFGYEYPVPVEYRAFPVQHRLPDGTLWYHPLAVPTRFKTFRSGFSVTCEK